MIYFRIRLFLFCTRQICSLLWKNGFARSSIRLFWPTTLAFVSRHSLEFHWGKWAKEILISSPLQALSDCGIVCWDPNINQCYPTGVTVTTKRKRLSLLHDGIFLCVYACINYKYYFFSPPSVFKMWFHISFNAKWFIYIVSSVNQFSYYGVIFHFVKICLLDKKSDRSCLWWDH